MAKDTKPRLVGLNHIALEVGDIEKALAFYGAIFDFDLRGRGDGRAFIDMGDQFLALMEGRTQRPDEQRHFGLVVDDRGRVRDLAQAAGAELIDGPFLDFFDPWGNRIEVVEYADLQFTKSDAILGSMGLKLEKSDKAKKELQDKGVQFAPSETGQNQ
ncbi:VOC family protein [Pararhizobium mangrovi]|uniref:VOC family protein n=1 Tax=Pararhizobium mangrovi TaxID=2590452 RepID=A0A506U052_9HYPH|nr:VOC family protein [Pararhizobium mangrovi]TPW27702.1 VOC family protein [Pararhizobium mangrovi]